jgi:hypothetical protein
MKVIGRENLTWYNDTHNLRQQPTEVERWQDSAWLNWWDEKNKVGGVFRIGHEYNNPDCDGPMVAAWAGLITPAGIYKRVVYLPLREDDKLANGWGGGDDKLRVVVEDGVHRWIINDPEEGVTATLDFADFHRPFNGFPQLGDTSADIAPAHIDVHGSIKGTMNVKGQSFQADGMGVRDHGWGHRSLGMMTSHRYSSGTFGPDFGYTTWAIHNLRGSVEIFGWIVRDNEIIFPKDIDIVAYTEIDSVSTRGGQVRFVLATDEILEFELTARAPGLMNYFHNMPNNNTVCSVSHNGRTGSGMLETSMNYQRGTQAPDKMQRGVVHNGFYPAPLYEFRDGKGESPFLIKTTIV